MDRKLSSADMQIRTEPDDYILNVNPTDYVGHLASTFSVEPPHISFDDVTASAYETNVKAGNFPRGFHAEPGATYRKQTIVYHLPIAGNTELLNCKSEKRLLWTAEVYEADECLCFEIINFYDDPEQIKQTARETIENICQQLQYVVIEIDAYNAALKARIEEAFSKRKKELFTQTGVLASLDVPIRKRDDVPETFTIPTPELRRRIAPKPQAAEKGFSPEPTLDQDMYIEIVGTIYDLGKMFERMPSTYVTKSEEDLRDHILLHLEPRFEGSATGETFNKSGKTDILLRFQNKNAFIAECKFWSGARGCSKTIDQLLSYLTWRDSKSAIILFVKNRDFSTTVERTQEVVSEHPCFLAARGQPSETWFDYTLHLPGDRGRDVKLAVLLFHFPDPENSPGAS